MISIGTRKSELALIQAKMVKDAIINKLNQEVTIKGISSKGDIDLVSPISSFRGQGVFTSRLEQELLEGKIDIAVHSLKDLPLEQPDELEIVTVLKRDTPNDVLLIKSDNLLSTSPLKIRKFSRIATGSIRRRSQLKALDPTIIPLDIRGNVHTRVKQLETEYIDGLVMSAAVFDRIVLKIAKNIQMIILPLDRFPTSPGQSAIAVQVRKGEYSELREIGDEDSFLITKVERELLGQFLGGCDSGVGISITNVGDSEIQLSSTYYLESIGTSNFNRILLQDNTINALKNRFLKFIASENMDSRTSDSKNNGNSILFLTDDETAAPYISEAVNLGYMASNLKIIEYETNYSLLNNSNVIQSWKSANWVIISSKHAIPFLNKLQQQFPKSKFKVAAVGYRTSEILRKNGFPVNIVSLNGMSELQLHLKEVLSTKDKVVYFSGESYTVSPFEYVDHFKVYSTKYLSVELPFEPDYIVGFSTKGVLHVINSLEKSSKFNWIVIGKSVQSQLDELGIKSKMAESPTVEGIVNTLKKELETYELQI